MAKIIQIVFAPQDATWQNRLLGLSDEGIVYSLDEKGEWEGFIHPLEYEN